jgi:hypothetical protein
MSLTKFAVGLLLAVSAIAADTPLPALRIEPTADGSVFYIKNNSSQRLKAYLIELVDYPGSLYSFWQDETVADAIPPNGEKRIQVANMTVGAVPDYVKMQAALYEGGATAGIPEKIAQMLDRRRAMLATVRELCARIEKAQAQKTPKGELLADWKQWADSLEPAGKGKRNSPAAVNQTAAKGVIQGASARLDAMSFAELLAVLRGWERALA